jgi:hypothetical protein
VRKIPTSVDPVHNISVTSSTVFALHANGIGPNAKDLRADSAKSRVQASSLFAGPPVAPGECRLLSCCLCVLSVSFLEFGGSLPGTVSSKFIVRSNLSASIDLFPSLGKGWVRWTTNNQHYNNRHNYFGRSN